jgi:hypothetical protein
MLLWYDGTPNNDSRVSMRMLPHNLGCDMRHIDVHAARPHLHELILCQLAIAIHIQF